MGSRSRSDVNYRNPCLTMHQPWASLLVYGIKRIEGRSWPSPVTGRLWIHAASKIPDPETIKAMEDFYKQLYALDGVTDLKFPEHYPVSRLLGCVEVVGCLKSEELASWEDVPQGVRLEGQTAFCWLCEQPQVFLVGLYLVFLNTIDHHHFLIVINFYKNLLQKLLVPFEMRGYQGVYNLEKRILEGALRGLCPVQPPLQVKFPLPDPRNQLSLRPGSLVHGLKIGPNKSKTDDGSSPDLAAAIAGARAAATQFSKKNYGPPAAGFQGQGSRTRNNTKEGGQRLQYEQRW
ncbi:hypothetical protein R6Q59_021731 [Mikania micrantha]